MPDLSYSHPAQAAQKATGTDGKGDGLRKACATGRTPADSGGQKTGREGGSESTDMPGKRGKSEKTAVESHNGPLAELADAMDSKSIAQKA